MAKEEKKEAAPQVEAPAGFEKVGSEIEGFWDASTGPVLAKLVEARRMGTNWAYVAEAQAPVGCTNKEGEKFTLPKGSTVGIWISTQLKPLVMNGGKVVWINRGKKVKLDGGKTMWQMDVRVDAKGEGKKMPCIDAGKTAVLEGDDDDIPF